MGFGGFRDLGVWGYLIRVVAFRRACLGVCGF